MGLFIPDQKGELYETTAQLDDRSLRIDVSDRETLGVDAFYGLHDTDDLQSIYQRNELIVSSLFPPSPAESEFWTPKARVAARAINQYCFTKKKMHTLTEIHEYGLSQPLEDTAKEIIANTSPSDREYRDMIDFIGMPAETLSGIFANYQLRISKLVNDSDIASILGVSRIKKYDPTLLLNNDVYMTIPPNRLEQMGELIFLILNLTFNWVLSLKDIKEDPDREPIGIIMDETSALLSRVGGKLTELPQFLRLARSKYAFAVLAVQSLSGLRSVYSNHEVDDMLSNIRNQVYFDASCDYELLSKLAGTTTVQESSYTSGTHGTSTNKSFVDKPVIKPEELIDIQNSGDVALMAMDAGGFYRLQRCNYFKDTYYKRILMKKEKQDE